MKWYTVKEAAERLKVGEGTILLRIKDSRFPHAKKNGKWRIPECCLEGHTEATAEEVKAAEEAKAVEEAKAAEEAKPDPEVVKLHIQRDRLLAQKEVKVLEAEVAGIWNPAAQDRIAEERKQLDVDSAKLAEREQGLTDREDEREVTLAEREQELLEGREKLEEDEVKWQELIAVVKADLQTIFAYYKRVCAAWPVKEEVLFDSLSFGLKDFWGQSGEAAPESVGGATENEGDEVIE